MKVYLLVEQWDEGFETMETVLSVFTSKGRAEESAQKEREKSFEYSVEYGGEHYCYYVKEFEVIE